MPPFAPVSSPSSPRPAPAPAPAPAPGPATASEEEAINWIRDTGREWVRLVLETKKGLGLGLGLGCVIYPFGSYALGVPEEEEDDGDAAKKKKRKNADLLCVGPCYVKPKDLSLLQDILLSKQEEDDDDGLISDVRWLPNPLVPRIEFTFRRLIHVHILYATIALPFLPHDLDICDDRSVLRDADLPTAMILDCCRTVRKLLRLVPHAHSFRAALRCLKLWAKRRAVYSSALGFLGDVSWALLLARICLDHPDASSSSPDTLLPLFFRTYRAWRWPDPVFLCPVEEDQDLAFPVWNPQKNPLERSARMPIITPAYPCMNSSRFVSIGTRQIMTDQFEAATRVCDQIHLGNADWTLLFEPYPFFQAYDHYLKFTTACDSRTGGDPREWKAGVESQLRTLTVSIERDLQGALQCHPYPNDYATSEAPKKRIFFAGLRWKEGTKHIDLELTRLEFTLYEFIDSLETQGTLASVTRVPRDSLPSFVFSDDAGAPVGRETTTTEKQILKRKRSADNTDDVEPPLAKRASTKAGIQEAFEQINEEMAAAAGKQRKRRRALLSESHDDIEPIPAKKFHSLTLANSS